MPTALTPPLRRQRCGALDDDRVQAVEQALRDRGVLLGDRGGAGAGLLWLGAQGLQAACAALRGWHAPGEPGGPILVGLVGAGELAAESHWQLLDAGAADVIDVDTGDAAVAAVVARLQRWAAIDALMASPLVRDNLVGGSAAWRHALRQVVEVAAFSDAHVLITGESGTGKELCARLVHTLGRQRQAAVGAAQPLVVLDCTTVVPELAGSEFFGHERGAYTGAAAARDGAFALADGGTLFLDEVGELPAPMQAQLLRVIQERSFKRVGGSNWQTSRFRLVCATHRDLLTEVARGAFRADLYWRIAGSTFSLPPLAERRADIVPLALHFLALALQDGAAPPVPPRLNPAVREHLQRRPYPGNVRELRQLMQRIAARHVGPGPVTVGDLPEDERPLPADAVPDWRGADLDNAIQRALGLGVGLRDIGAAAANAAIRIAVDEEGGNLQRAARRLGVTDRALQLRRAGHGVSPPG